MGELVQKIDLEQKVVNREIAKRIMDGVLDFDTAYRAFNQFAPQPMPDMIGILISRAMTMAQIQQLERDLPDTELTKVNLIAHMNIILLI